MAREVAERRANPRVSAIFDLHSAPSDGGGVVARMQAADLSLGGLRCTSNADYPEMTRLAVRLELPIDGNGECDPVDIDAVVVRRTEIPSLTQEAPRYELALFFPQLNDDVKERLARYLDR